MIVMILLVVVLTILGFVLIIEAAHRSVFGGPLGDKTIEKLLQGTEEIMMINRHDRNMIMIMSKNGGVITYFAKTQSPLSKWHFADVGTIPRWSKWSKWLDDKQIELLSNETKDD